MPNERPPSEQQSGLHNFLPISKESGACSRLCAGRLAVRSPDLISHVYDEKPGVARHRQRHGGVGLAVLGGGKRGAAHQHGGRRQRGRRGHGRLHGGSRAAAGQVCRSRA
eukprot:366552-Chlamydomonas_euryale.AAC.5